MVKGIHKKIIEINHPNSVYFEKAVFYLRPGVTQLPQNIAESAARELLEEIEPTSNSKIRNRYFLILTAILSCAVTLTTCLFLLK